MYIYMGHGQYLVYSSKSSIFEECQCIIVFQVLVYKQMLSFFLKSVLSFSKPQLNFQKKKMSRILLSINLNFGCSSYIYIYMYIIYYTVYICISYITLYIYVYHILHCIYYTLSLYIYIYTHTIYYTVSVNRTFGGDLKYRCPNHN